jgi:hypothetical protein
MSHLPASPGCLFINPSLKSSFVRQGYCVIRDIVAPQIDFLSRIATGLNFQPDRFIYSLMEKEAEYNQALHHGIAQVILPIISDLFQPFRLLSASFLIKPAGLQEELILHQDWTFTFEDRFMPMTMWIPLVDVGEQNGGLFVLPRSHRILENFRSLSYGSAQLSRTNKIQPYVQPIHANKGDVIFFHPALFHGSYSNPSSHHRIVLAATLLPLDAPYIHVRKLNNQQASVEYLRDTAFFHDLQHLDKDSAFRGVCSDVINYTHEQPNELRVSERLSAID